MSNLQQQNQRLYRQRKHCPKVAIVVEDVRSRLMATCCGYSSRHGPMISIPRIWLSWKIPPNEVERGQSKRRWSLHCSRVEEMMTRPIFCMLRARQLQGWYAYSYRPTTQQNNSQSSDYMTDSVSNKHEKIRPLQICSKISKRSACLQCPIRNFNNDLRYCHLHDKVCTLLAV
jgi:hypothetical protein